MILSCNSCKKKFVVPDDAIGASGRLVQCSSCGNKWKQFPINQSIKIKEKIAKIKSAPEKIKKLPKKKKQKIKKRTGPNLYSPEYLAKKHGIKIDKNSTIKNEINKNNSKISFGFYNSLIVFIAFVVLLSGVFINNQETIIRIFPKSEIYIGYIFETIYNIQIIIHDLISNFPNL